MGLVYVADTICGQVGQGFNLTSRTQTLDASVLSEFHLDTATLEQFKTTIPNLASECTVRVWIIFSRYPPI